MLYSQALNFGINILLGIHAVITKSEILFDLIGAVANVGAIITSMVLVLIFQEGLTLRNSIIGGFIILWGSRLGLFL